MFVYLHGSRSLRAQADPTFVLELSTKNNSGLCEYVDLRAIQRVIQRFIRTPHIRHIYTPTRSLSYVNFTCHNPIWITLITLTGEETTDVMQADFANMSNLCSELESALAASKGRHALRMMRYVN